MKKIIKVFYRLDSVTDRNCLDDCPVGKKSGSSIIKCGSTFCKESCAGCVGHGVIPVMELGEDKFRPVRNFVYCRFIYSKQTLRLKFMRFLYCIKLTINFFKF